MPTSSILIDIDDPRTDSLAEAISNKTVKKILSLLSESELTESELAEKLALPLNTIDYNIKKLESVGLIQKARRFSWSPKGKAVYRYQISNKRIVISPKPFSKGVLPAILATIISAITIKWYGNIGQTRNIPMHESLQDTAVQGAPAMMKSAQEAAPVLTQVIQPFYTQPWFIFLLGGLFAIIVFCLWNLKKHLK